MNINHYINIYEYLWSMIFFFGCRFNFVIVSVDRIHTPLGGGEKKGTIFSMGDLQGPKTEVR